MWALVEIVSWRCDMCCGMVEKMGPGWGKCPLLVWGCLQGWLIGDVFRAGLLGLSIVLVDWGCL